MDSNINNHLTTQPFNHLTRPEVECFISSVPDFSNLSYHQITGTTLKNTNIEMRIFKILNKNIMMRPFLVLVIDIFVICICFEFRPARPRLFVQDVSAALECETEINIQRYA